MFYAFKVGSQKPVVLLTGTLIEVSELLLTQISCIRVLKLGNKYCFVRVLLFVVLRYFRFVNMMYDFQFSAGKRDDVCQLSDLVNNPNPELGCNFFQASIAFSAFTWYVGIENTSHL